MLSIKMKIKEKKNYPNKVKLKLSCSSVYWSLAEFNSLKWRTVQFSKHNLAKLRFDYFQFINRKLE